MGSWVVKPGHFLLGWPGHGWPPPEVPERWKKSEEVVAIWMKPCKKIGCLHMFAISTDGCWISSINSKLLQEVSAAYL